MYLTDLRFSCFVFIFFFFFFFFLILLSLIFSSFSQPTYLSNEKAIIIYSTELQNLFSIKFIYLLRIPLTLLPNSYLLGLNSMLL